MTLSSQPSNLATRIHNLKISTLPIPSLYVLELRDD